jgi:hypothetical protein
MKVKMKKMEQLCMENCSKFAKGWDYYAAASDSYLQGYKQARKDIYKATIFDDLTTEVTTKIDSCGEDEVEVDIGQGGQQLSLQTFVRWKEAHKDNRIKDAINILRENNLLSDEELDILLK